MTPTPAAFRTTARALARRVRDAGRPERATTLRGASMMWTIARAARTAADAFVCDTANTALYLDLVAFSREVSTAVQTIPGDARPTFDVTVSL